MLDSVEEIKMRVEPDSYIELPGWLEDTSNVRSITDLPENAYKYIEAIEQHCEVAIDMVSVGPDRDSIIEINNVFEES